MQTEWDRPNFWHATGRDFCRSVRIRSSKEVSQTRVAVSCRQTVTRATRVDATQHDNAHLVVVQVTWLDHVILTTCRLSCRHRPPPPPASCRLVLECNIVGACSDCMMGCAHVALTSIAPVIVWPPTAKRQELAVFDAFCTGAAVNVDDKTQLLLIGAFRHYLQLDRI